MFELVQIREAETQRGKLFSLRAECEGTRWMLYQAVADMSAATLINTIGQSVRLMYAYNRHKQSLSVKAPCN